MFLASGAVRSLIDAAHVRRLFDDHRTGRADHAQLLWTVWMLARWGSMASVAPALRAAAVA